MCYFYSFFGTFVVAFLLVLVTVFFVFFLLCARSCSNVLFFLVVIIVHCQIKAVCKYIVFLLKYYIHHNINMVIFRKFNTPWLDDQRIYWSRAFRQVMEQKILYTCNFFSEHQLIESINTGRQHTNKLSVLNHCIFISLLA